MVRTGFPRNRGFPVSSRIPVRTSSRSKADIFPGILDIVLPDRDSLGDVRKRFHVLERGDDVPVPLFGSFLRGRFLSPVQGFPGIHPCYFPVGTLPEYYFVQRAAIYPRIVLDGTFPVVVIGIQRICPRSF